jgi:hypothetical protein
MARELGRQQSQPAIPPEQQALEHFTVQIVCNSTATDGATRPDDGHVSSHVSRQDVYRSQLLQQQIDQQQGGVAGTNVATSNCRKQEVYKAPHVSRRHHGGVEEGYPERYKELMSSIIAVLCASMV